MDHHFAEALIKPILLIIGLIGNSLTIFILFRRKTTTTNIYLLSIFFTDLFRLIVSNIKSLEYYHFIHINFPYFWHIRRFVAFFGLATPLISLLIVVSFTIDRYIAIKDPLRKHKFNTKFAARCTVLCIVIVCLIASINVIFTVPLYKEKVGYNFENGEFCNLTENLLKDQYLNLFDSNESFLYGFENKTNKLNILKLNSTISIDQNLFKNQSAELRDLQLNSTVLFDDNNQTIKGSYHDYYNIFPGKNLEFEIVSNKSISAESNKTNICQRVDYYYIAISKALENGHTISKWYMLSVGFLFNVIPIFLLMFFNTKLILLIKDMKTRRMIMPKVTNPQNKAGIPKKNSYYNFTISHENRSIIKLITLKAAITITRLPIIILQFFYSFFSRKTLDILITVVTILLDFNATLNFFIFCLLSKNFRSDLYELYLTFKSYFNRYKRRTSTDTCTSSSSSSTAPNNKSIEQSIIIVDKSSDSSIETAGTYNPIEVHI